MSTLTKQHLRMTHSFTDGHEIAPYGISDAETKPFGYRFANWNPLPADPEDEISGHYDPVTQTWQSPLGVPTMGYPTYTRTSGSKCGDCVQDDACA